MSSWRRNIARKIEIEFEPGNFCYLIKDWVVSGKLLLLTYLFLVHEEEISLEKLKSSLDLENSADQGVTSKPKVEQKNQEKNRNRVWI